MGAGAVIVFDKKSGQLAVRLRYDSESLRAILKAAWRKVGEYWHENFRLEHFKNSAMSRYNYTPRRGESGSGFGFKGSYTKGKMKKFGHTKPLVYTGQSMHATALRDIRPRHDGVKIHLHAPLFNFRPKGGRIDLNLEMTALTAGEVEQLSRVFNEHLQAEIDQIEKDPFRN